MERAEVRALMVEGPQVLTGASIQVAAELVWSF